MSISIITYADLGERENLKTCRILPLISKFEKSGVLRQIICRTNKNFYFKETYSAVPIFLRYILHGIKKIFPRFKLRIWEEKIFDFISVKKIKDNKFFLFHQFNCPLLLKKNKEKKFVSIGIITNMPIACYTSIFRQEEKVLGIVESKEVKNKRENKIKKENEMYHDYNYLVVYSEISKKQIVKYENFPADKIFVATPDIKYEKFEGVYEKREKSDKFRAVYIGNVNIMKGMYYLFKAWKDVGIPNKELIVVGDLNIFNKIKYLFKDILDDNDSIKFVGSTKNPEGCYKKADVFVFPSLAEGSPRVVLEAMYCGLPVITTENAPAIVKDGETGFVIPIQNSEKIVEKINYMYENKEKRIKMGEKAREAVLNKEPFEEQVFKIYQKIKDIENIKK